MLRQRASIRVTGSELRLQRFQPAVAIGGAAVFSSPLSISGCVGWYDFSDISTLWQNTGRSSAVTADGQSILGMSDKSGNANHLSQALGPIYKANIQNGLSVGRFTGGSSNRLEGTLASTQPYTVFVVASVTVAATNQYFVDGAVSYTGIVNNNNATSVGNYAGAPALLATITSGAMTSKHVISAIFNGASSLVAFDGTATTGTTGTGSTTGVTIGTGGGGGVAPVTGDICEVIFYNTGLSTSNRNTVETWLISKWGIT